ncbi:MAG: hypothetical protein OCD00_03790 [Colwellia sp.]
MNTLILNALKQVNSIQFLEAEAQVSNTQFISANKLNNMQIIAGIEGGRNASSGYIDLTLVDDELQTSTNCVTAKEYLSGTDIVDEEGAIPLPTSFEPSWSSLMDEITQVTEGVFKPSEIELQEAMNMAIAEATSLDRSNSGMYFVDINIALSLLNELGISGEKTKLEECLHHWGENGTNLIEFGKGSLNRNAFRRHLIQYLVAGKMVSSASVQYEAFQSFVSEVNHLLSVNPEFEVIECLELLTYCLEDSNQFKSVSNAQLAKVIRAKYGKQAKNAATAIEKAVSFYNSLPKGPCDLGCYFNHMQLTK